MAISRLKTGSSNSPKQPNSGRRSFIWKTGAAMSAVIASAAAGISKFSPDHDSGLKGDVDRLSNQIGRLEDANAIRRLHQTYESYLDKGMYDEVVDMFAGDAEAVFNGGVFSGKDKGVRRLYCDHFSQGRTGRKIEPAPGFEPDPARLLDVVEVAPDRKSAKAQFPYSMQVGTPLTGDLPLLEMARLQGQGIRQWWEGGIHEVSYVKEGDAWKIKRLEYQVMSKADYKPGRSYAKPISVPQFSGIYPENPNGPDKLIAAKSKGRQA
ncbi:MAG: nuclear transport factor 2 family protein [Acidobacteria bacterium]|nr:nuclear transport factor 2 family protein [Acidobacteriota bacterium]